MDDNGIAERVNEREEELKRQRDTARAEADRLARVVKHHAEVIGEIREERDQAEARAEAAERKAEELEVKAEVWQADNAQLKAMNDALAEAGTAHENVIHVSQDEWEQLKQQAEENLAMAWEIYQRGGGWGPWSCRP